MRTCSSPSTAMPRGAASSRASRPRSEEHTSELQSQSNLVCRLLLEKKKQHADACCGLTALLVVAPVLVRDTTPRWRARRAGVRVLLGRATTLICRLIERWCDAPNSR